MCVIRCYIRAGTAVRGSSGARCCRPGPAERPLCPPGVAEPFVLPAAGGDLKGRGEKKAEANKRSDGLALRRRNLLGGRGKNYHSFSVFSVFSPGTGVQCRLLAKTRCFAPSVALLGPGVPHACRGDAVSPFTVSGVG